MTQLKSYAKHILTASHIRTLGLAGKYSALYNQTYLTVPNSLPTDIIDTLIKIINSTIEKNSKDDFVWSDQIGSDIRIIGFENLIPEYIKHFNVPSHIREIEAYTGRKVRSWFLMANRTSAISGNLGSGGGYHRDSPYSHQIKCIWYLSDVKENNGPFQVVLNSHRNLVKNRRRYPLGQLRFDRIEDDMVSVLGKKGTLVICDTKCIHRGKPIESGSRYAVTLYTSPKENSKEEHLHKLG